MTPFETAVERIRAGADRMPEARQLAALLTPEERLSLLDGGRDFWAGIEAMMAGDREIAPQEAAALPRIGLPGLHFSDGPRGCALGRSTAFPVAMARAASWDLALEERIAEAIGAEIRAQGGDLWGGICINLVRHPGWGRAQESFGEDPFLVSEMGAADVRGARRHVMACAKHFALNSIENARFRVDVTADERTLREVYLPHFKRAVDEGAEVIMSAYNSLNGEWCGHNGPLLNGILREQWGFDGIVISDWIFGMRDAVASVKGGLDIEMPFKHHRHPGLPPALADGRVTWDEIDAIATRIIAAQLRYRARPKVPKPSRDVVAGETHRALAREAAEASMVLLKNDPVGGGPLLPLERSALRRVAVLGRLADRANTGDRGSSNVRAPEVITPLEGLREALPGVEFAVDASQDGPTGARVAAGADVAIVIAGYTSRDEGEYITFGPDPDLVPLYPPRPGGGGMGTPDREAAVRAALGGDRRSLTLTPADEALILAVAAANPRTVVVFEAGSAVIIEAWKDRVPAILQAFYPGMEGGRALARLLLGEVSPSGRLPFAVPTDAAHLPDFDPDARTVTYDLWHGQWKLDRDGHAAAFPFGFGLGYTTFEVRDTAARLEGDSVRISASVTNTGRMRGSTVVQVYGGVPSSRYERPLRKLVGFAKVALDPAETRSIDLVIPIDRLAVWDGGWVLEPGRYRFEVGQFAGDPGAKAVEVEVR